MVLTKITIDIGVKYVPKSEQRKEGKIKPNTIKTGSVPRKQNTKNSQNKKITRNVTT